MFKSRIPVFSFFYRLFYRLFYALSISFTIFIIPLKAQGSQSAQQNQFNNFSSVTNVSQEEFNYEEELEEYQQTKLVPYVDFIFFTGFQFSVFNEQNSRNALRGQVDFLKNAYNAVNPNALYVNNQDSTSGPIALNLDFNLYYYDLGFGFSYHRSNFFNSVVSIDRNDSLPNNEDYFTRYTFNMSGHSLVFDFLYRFRLLEQTPQENIYIVLGAGYTYNFGEVSLKEEVSFRGTEDQLRKSERNNRFSIDGHGAHFSLGVLFKVEYLVIETGINWNILSFNSNPASLNVLLPQYQPESFSLSLSPLAYFKIGLAF